MAVKTVVSKENQRRFIPSQGSNPCLSAIHQPSYLEGILRATIRRSHALIGMIHIGFLGA